MKSPSGMQWCGILLMAALLAMIAGHATAPRAGRKGTSLIGKANVLEEKRASAASAKSFTAAKMRAYRSGVAPNLSMTQHKTNALNQPTFKLIPDIQKKKRSILKVLIDFQNIPKPARCDLTAQKTTPERDSHRSQSRYG